MDSGVLPFLKNQKIWQCRVLFSYGRVQPGPPSNCPDVWLTMVPGHGIHQCHLPGPVVLNL